jgi:hypothetical protein
VRLLNGNQAPRHEQRAWQLSAILLAMFAPNNFASFLMVCGCCCCCCCCCCFGCVMLCHHSHFCDTGRRNTPILLVVQPVVVIATGASNKYEQNLSLSLSPSHINMLLVATFGRITSGIGAPTAAGRDRLLRNGAARRAFDVWR